MDNPEKNLATAVIASAIDDYFITRDGKPRKPKKSDEHYKRTAENFLFGTGAHRKVRLMWCTSAELDEPYLQRKLKERINAQS